MPHHFSVIFAGTPAFAVPSVQALLDDDAFRVELVITQPDKPVGRSQELTASPVKMLAEKKKIPIWQPQNIKKEMTRHWSLVTGHCDFLVLVAYGQLLSQEILDLPHIAPVNLHASLLPRWRGASPIQHAILAGDTESGVTVQRMIRALDAGPILGQHSVTLQERETATTLHDTLAAAGATLLVNTLKETLQEGEQDVSLVTACGKLSREDGLVDPSAMTAIEIDRRVRALTPWPGVRATIRGHEVKVLETNLEPVEHALSLECAGHSTLFVTKLQSPGGKPLMASEWVKGHPDQ